MKSMVSIDAAKGIAKGNKNYHILLATFNQIQIEKRRHEVTGKNTSEFNQNSFLGTKYALKTLSACESIENILSKRVSEFILYQDIFWL